MQSYNRTHIQQHFNRSADSYNEAAVLQKQVANHLDERLDLITINPKVIIDIGAGTGFLTKKIIHRYPKSKVYGVDLSFSMLQNAQKHLSQGLTNKTTASFLKKMAQTLNSKKSPFINADTYNLPFADNSVDLIVSNLMLQWCDNLDVVFKELRRVLRQEKVIIFTTFGPDTLKELRQSWSKTDQTEHVNTFIDMHDIGDALVRNGFGQPVMDVEIFTLTYNKPLDVLKDLKAIGATNANSQRTKGLMGKQRFAKMLVNYEGFREHRDDAKIPATYEVVHGHAWASQDIMKGPHRDRSGIIEITLEQFHRQK